jgi:hypothetical protein
MVCAEIRDVTGSNRHELMILTGLMGTRMFQNAYRKYTVFPVSISTCSDEQYQIDVCQVLMLSIYGSKARIVQAHMSLEQLRLQVRYNEFFDFRNLTKEWQDIFVRWFLNEPLAVPSLPCELTSPEHPESSGEEGGSLVAASSKSQTYISDEPRSPEREGTTQKSLSSPTRNPQCNAKEANLDQTMARSSTLLKAQ